MNAKVLSENEAKLVSTVSVGRSQTITEEILNSVTHGIGMLAALAGATVLVTLAVIHGDPWKIFALSIYGGCLFLLYFASTLYHGIQHSPTKQLLRVFDHCSIYLLIAGTYTPFLLVNLRSSIGWALFGIIWCLALTGIFFKIFRSQDYEQAHLVNYLAMGWLVLLAYDQFAVAFSDFALAMIIAGGLCYTAGVVIFLKDRHPYLHTIWHLFVLAGSAFHYIAIFYGVLHFQQPIV